MTEEINPSPSPQDPSQDIPPEEITDPTQEEIQSKIVALGSRFHFGRKRIVIPLEKNNLTPENIGRYINHIMACHQENVTEYRHLHGIYRGDQEILKKQRLYDEANKGNTIIVENHAFSMVEFKKGYQYGDGVKLSMESESDCPQELSEFSKILRACDYDSKNIDLAECLYTAGTARRITLPLKEHEKKYNRKKVKVPFRTENLEFEESFVVYSTAIGHDKLFGGVISKQPSSDINDRKYTLTIYTDDLILEYDYTPMGIAQLKSEGKNTIGVCPIVEYDLNKSQLGIIEVVETILNGVNLISSNSVDNIVDFVNSLLVFYNQEVDIKRLKDLLEAGALEVNSNDPSRPADVKYLVNALNQADVLAKYEALITVAYDIAGVPRASGTFTSGGDTGQARLLGGGWTRADIVAKQDEKSIIKGINQDLDVMLAICKMDPACPINEIYPEDIKISFNRTNSDNLLVKTQSLSNLIAMNFPKEAALNAIGLVSGIHEVCQQWEDQIEKSKQEAIELADKQKEQETGEENDKVKKSGEEE